MIDFIQVGKKLANYRKQNNMTQDDLASMLFVTRQLISKWEKGVGVPSLDVVIELSKIFKVSIEDLLCLNDEENFILYGKEAVECLRKENYDLVLTDIKMPIMGGLELAEWIENNMEKEKQPMIIAISGYAEFE